MKRFIIILLIAVILGEMVTIPGYTKDGFSDMEASHWAYEAVMTLREQEIISGYSNGEYRPNNAVTFNELVKLLVVAHGGVVEPNGSDWAKPYREYGINRNWFDEGYYPYNEPITREVCAYLIDQYFNVEAEVAGSLIKNIKDYGTIDDRYRLNVLRVYKQGVLAGDDQGRFNPKASLSRAECAVIIMRLLNEDMRKDTSVVDEVVFEEIKWLQEFENDLIVTFNITDVQKINDITMAVIREKRYGSESGPVMAPFWLSVAGGIDESYGTEAERLGYEPDYHKWLQDVETISSSKTDVIDFVHMIAVIDTIYTDMSAESEVEKYIDYLCGFAGDIETFAINLKDYVDQNQGMDYDKKFIYALNHIGEEGVHYFTKEDYLADVDGVNIANLMIEKQLLLSEALNQYYIAGYTTRYGEFVNSFGGVEGFEKVIDQLIDGENTPLKSEFTTFRTMIVMTNGGSFFNQPSSDDTKAVYNAFAHKILLGVGRE